MVDTIDLFGSDEPVKLDKTTEHIKKTKKQNKEKAISFDFSFDTRDISDYKDTDISRKTDKSREDKTEQKQKTYNEEDCKQLIQSIAPICEILHTVNIVLQKQKSEELGRLCIQIVSMYIKPCVYFDCIIHYANIDNALTSVLLEHMERFLRQLYIVPIDSKACRILLDAGLPDTFITELKSKLAIVQQQNQFSIDVLLYTDRTEFDKHIKQCSIQQNKDFVKQFITNFDRIYDCVKQCLSNTKAQNILLQ